MKIKPIQMLLPLKFPKKKAVQMTFRFKRDGHPPIPVKPEPKPTGKKLSLFM